MNLLEMMTFKSIMDQIARERRASRRTLDTIVRMREWQQQIRLYSELHRRYYAALDCHDIQTAERLLDVLTHYQPRYQA
jgi:hypothetical protein